MGAIAAAALLLLTPRAEAQRYNLIPNGSFENPVATNCNTTEPGEILTGWTSFLWTADPNWEECKSFGFPATGKGRQWIFMFNTGSGSEAITTELKEPLRVGGTYDLSFLAVTNNPMVTTWFSGTRILAGKGRMRVYLSEEPFNALNYTSQTVIWGGADQADGEIDRKAHKWHQYGSSFVADRPYRYIAFAGVDGVRNNGIGLDDVQLYNREFICTGNIVPNASFETRVSNENRAWPRDWYGIQGDYGAEFHSEVNPEDELLEFAHSGNCWFVLTSFRGLTNNANSAVGIELTRPMVVGQRYRLSFHGVTKSNLFHDKGEIRWMADTVPIEWVDNTGGNLSGSVIWDDMTVTGTTMAWRAYDNMDGFVADRPYTHIAIQARDGYHVAIDDICVTSVPNSHGVVEFERASYSVVESQGPATITLRRVDGTLGEVDVTFRTLANGGSATLGADYLGITSTVHFDPEQTTATVQIPIQDDQAIEGDETVALVLDDATGGATLGLRGAILTIQDDPTGKAHGSGGGPTVARKMSTATNDLESQLRRGNVVWMSNRNADGNPSSDYNLWYTTAAADLPPVFIPGTEDGRDPAWSFDGRYIAYVKSVQRMVMLGDAQTSVTGDCLFIIDRTGRIYANYFAPTYFGATHLGAPEWSSSGDRIVVSFWNSMPVSGIGSIDFLHPYSFPNFTAATIIGPQEHRTTLDPVLSPDGKTLYFHGADDADLFASESGIYSLDLTQPSPAQTRLTGNGDLIDHAFHVSLDPSGTQLTYSSDLWRGDQHEIFEDDELLRLDLASGKETRVSTESANDWGRYATGRIASGQMARHNDLQFGNRDIFLQKEWMIRSLAIADETNQFDDRNPSWVIPAIYITQLHGTHNPVGPGIMLNWNDIRSAQSEPVKVNVERSLDEENWTVIGDVSRPLELDAEQMFTFIDEGACELPGPFVYYRLSMDDPEGEEGIIYTLSIAIQLPCEVEPNLE